MGNEAELLAAKWGIPITIALLAIGIRLLFTVARITPFGIFRSIIVSLFVGWLAANYLFGIPEISDGTKAVVIAFAAILAEDIVVGVFKLGGKFREDPESFLRYFRKGQE